MRPLRENRGGQRLCCAGCARSPNATQWLTSVKQTMNVKHYLPHLAGAIVGSVAGWYAAGEFVARVAITDAMRIAASGVLLLLAAAIGFQIARRLGAGRGQP